MADQTDRDAVAAVLAVALHDCGYYGRADLHPALLDGITVVAADVLAPLLAQARAEAVAAALAPVEQTCDHDNVRTFRSLPPHSKCLDCGMRVQMRWVAEGKEAGAQVEKDCLVVPRYECGRCGERLGAHASRQPGWFECPGGGSAPWGEFRALTTVGEQKTEKDVVRTYRHEFVDLSANGSDCEACGRHMREHEWADLDPNGFVMTCVFSSGEDGGDRG